MNDSREAQFVYYGLNETITKLEHPPDDSKFKFNSSVVIKRKLLKSEKFAIEGKCGSLYHYLFLNQGQQYYITIVQETGCVTTDMYSCQGVLSVKAMNTIDHYVYI